MTKFKVYDLKGFDEIVRQTMLDNSSHWKVCIEIIFKRTLFIKKIIYSGKVII
jgi:hypothetical protein